MRKFLLSLLLLAPAVQADQFYVSMTFDDAATLLINKNLPLPKDFQMYRRQMWGFVDTGDEGITDYLDASGDVYVVGDNHRSYLQQACPDKAPPCILSLFKE